MRGGDILDRFVVAHAEAVARSGAHRVSLALAGRRLSFVFAGRDLAERDLRAFAHLPACADDGTPPDLEIRAFDTAFSGVEPPVRPWEDERPGPRFELRGSAPDGTFMTYTADPAAFTVYDPRRKLALHWSRAGADYPVLALASPFHFALCWWAEASGAVVIHAAAVGSNGRGVLLAGKGGSGKSTTALGCLERGLAFAGDDAVWCEVQGARPVAWPLYATARVLEEDLARFPQLASAVAPAAASSPGDKRVLFFGEAHRERIRPLPLSALYLPAPARERATRFEPAGRSDALRALFPWSLEFHPHSGARAVFSATVLMGRLPKARLLLGTDRQGAVDAIATSLGALAPH